jgi:DNA replication protein DnaC
LCDVVRDLGYSPDDTAEQERRNLQQAFQTARQYAENPQDWLLLLGEHGSGKTHLAAAIANFRHKLGEPVIMVTAPDLLDYLRDAFNPTVGVAFSARFHEIRTSSLLVIDNLDLTNASSWAREKIHQIADYRYLSRLPTVFTTTQAFEELDSFMRSRLLDRRRCKVFALLAPDYMGGAVHTRRP